MATAPPVPPTNLECPMPECTYTTGDKTEAVAVALLNAHMYSHKQSKRSGSRLKPPSIDEGATMEVWNNFERKWNMYKEGERITGSDVSYHLFQCAESALGDALLKSDPNISSKGETEILKQMKNLAVIPVATGIVRAELLEMRNIFVMKRSRSLRLGYVERLRPVNTILASLAKEPHAITLAMWTSQTISCETSSWLEYMMRIYEGRCMVLKAS